MGSPEAAPNRFQTVLINLTVSTSTGSNYHHLLGWSRFLPPTSWGGLGRVDTVKLGGFLRADAWGARDAGGVFL